MRRSAALLALTALLGCTDPAEIVLVIDTDLPTDRLAEILVRAEAPESFSRETRTAIADDADLPMTLVLRGPPGHTLSLSVRALDSAGAERLEWRAELSFLEGRSLRLDAPLLERCVDCPCPQEQRCSAEGCAPVVVMESTLPDYEAPAMRVVVESIACAPDAGLDEDAGPPDAEAVDSGVPCVAIAATECRSAPACKVVECVDCVFGDERDLCLPERVPPPPQPWICPDCCQFQPDQQACERAVHCVWVQGPMGATDCLPRMSVDDAGVPADAEVGDADTPDTPDASAADAS